MNTILINRKGQMDKIEKSISSVLKNNPTVSTGELLLRVAIQSYNFGWCDVYDNIRVVDNSINLDFVPNLIIT